MAVVAMSVWDKDMRKIYDAGIPVLRLEEVHGLKRQAVYRVLRRGMPWG